MVRMGSPVRIWKSAPVIARPPAIKREVFIFSVFPMYVPPQYTALFSEAWLWKEWPEREALGYRRLPDTGIDIVAKLREEEGFCAVQYKFQQTRIAVEDLASFPALSGIGGFTRRLVVATAPLTSNADDLLSGKTVPVSVLSLEEMEETPFDRSRFLLDRPQDLRRLPSSPSSPIRPGNSLRLPVSGFPSCLRCRPVLPLQAVFGSVRR